MQAAWLILGNDLRQRSRDRSIWIMAIAAPLALAAVFALTLPDVNQGIDPPRWVVVDEDGGTLANLFTAFALPIAADGLEATISVVEDRAVAAARVADGTYDAGFVVPAGAGDTGAGPVVEVLTVQGRLIQSLVAEAVARAFAHGVEQVLVATAAAEELGASASELQAVPGIAFATALPATIVEVPAADRVLDLTTFLSAGMAVMFLFFAVPFGVTSLLEERSMGTLARLRVAPVPAWSILAGKVATSLVIGVASMGSLILATSLLLGASWGDLLGVASLVIAGVVAAVSLVGVVAAVARTPEQASVAQAILAIVLAMFGGVFFPVSQGPGLLRFLSLLTPHAWFLRGLGDLAVPGATAADVAGPVGMLLAFGLGGALMSALLGRNRILAP